MNKFNINQETYKISDNYVSFRNEWLETLNGDTKILILDYTILWNLVEHQVYEDNFDKCEKTEKCIETIVNSECSKEKIEYVYKLFVKYISKYQSLEELYESFLFKKSRIDLILIKELLGSEKLKDKLRLLIYSCYRVRCNLFHGPKCIENLNEQKLLFLSMNELLALILKSYY